MGIDRCVEIQQAALDRFNKCYARRHADTGELLAGAGMPHISDGLSRRAERDKSITKNSLCWGSEFLLIQHNVHFIFICLQDSTASDNEYAVQSYQEGS